MLTSGPRGDYVQRDAVVCRERLMRPGLRSAQDEAVLADLDATAKELAASVQSLRPDLAGHTWLVESYYPDNPISEKISFAAKNALIAEGLRVSDRTPLLGAGDVDVLTRMEPDAATPAACARYAANGSVGEGDALLVILARDTRSTVLQAGLCTAEGWSWLP